ncbi:MAG: penicillin-binding protein, partial [Arenibacter algicola]|nr:penicillin-binding protein [Arenibacter algicola]
WFMGMVPNRVTGVWVGGDDKAVHFRTITYGQGASMALPIWGLYMKKNYANKELGISDGEFEKPENLSINVDCSKTSTEEDNKIDIEDDLDF